MAARTKRTTRTARNPTNAADRLGELRASALGAVDKIVRQGAGFRARARKLALAGAREARAALLEAKDAVTARAGEARSRTMGAVSHLEKVFETRVHDAVSRLGVPTSREVRALSRQVARLQQSVDRLRRARARA